MEDQFIWKVSLGCDDYIEVRSAEDALKLGKKFSSLIADLGVYKAEVERLSKGSFVTAVPSEQYERIIKAGDAVVLCLCAETDEQHKRRCALNWLAAKEGRDAK